MRLREQADGSVVVDGVHGPQLELLHAVPELLESDDPRLRDRRLPRTYADDEEDRKWRALVGDDLEHLFASQAETVRKDLDAAVRTSGAGPLALVRRGTWRFAIPAAHRQAWLAALNGASHALYVLHELTPSDVRRDLEDFADPHRAFAVLRIHVYGAMLAALLDLEGFGFPDDASAPEPD